MIEQKFRKTGFLREANRNMVNSVQQHEMPVINQRTFDIVHEALTFLLQECGPLSYREMVDHFQRLSTPEFSDSIEWYVLIAKLHMESSGEVESLTDEQPERVRLIH